MNKHIKNAIRLSWSEVSSILNKIITSQLDRQVSCNARLDDTGYWSISLNDGYFTVDELKILLDFIDADLDTRYYCLPPDSDTSRSVSMNVAERLLSIELGTTWEHISICREGLWLIGIEDISNLSKIIAKRGDKHEEA